MVIDPQRIRKALGPEWSSGNRFGDDSWIFDTADEHRYRRVIVSHWPEPDGSQWIHASISYSDRETMPSYEDMCLLHKACFPGFAYQVFAPVDKHIDLVHNVLHLWGRADGKPAMPNFGRFGTI